jgi:hypothetical protein
MNGADFVVSNFRADVYNETADGEGSGTPRGGVRFA